MTTETKPPDDGATKVTQTSQDLPQQPQPPSTEGSGSDPDETPAPGTGALVTGEPPTEAPGGDDSGGAPAPVYSIYTTWEKRWIVVGGSLAATFSPLTAQIYLPALTVLARDFSVTDTQINLTVTTYMIFQAIAPMFIGGFADTAGRRPAYALCFVIYIAANIGLARCQTYAQLLVVRSIQSAGSSSTVALCQAIVADITTSAERGQYIGITVLPIVVGPSLGPVLGGVIAQYLGWRWIFYMLAIAAGVTLTAMAFFFPETCRHIVGDGSVRAHPVYHTFWQIIKNNSLHRRGRRAQAARDKVATDTNPPATADGPQRAASPAPSRPAPVKFKFTPPNLMGSIVMLFQKELGILLAYNSIVFAGFYAIATALPSQLSAPPYNLSGSQVGLIYLPVAGGSIGAAAVCGPALGRNYARHAARLDPSLATTSDGGGGKKIKVDRKHQADLSRFPIERARLEVGLPLLLLSAAVTAAVGWALRASAHLAVLCVLLFLLGVGLVGFNNTVNTLIVDVSPGRAAAAVAANNLTRCLVGAAASAAILPMIDAIGAGWAFTVFGATYVVFAPAMWVVMARGIRWRTEVKEKEERKAEKKKALDDEKNGIGGAGGGRIGEER
ncbi:major facilitator superfamily domain-containing protein [Lasiosphaeria miniovina]|uniref:Major facilitator superfamily domain-containing protein n=1 Tax=Lasiosphaeria miniovina TaxID=1954250 RepID=A0AA40AMH3_9PEZI|nr:major facilitator superfamily domain-containing protein [Lasiosphaeria miniovina]KAK0718577.1 major facilitator superfamily domain-containing protein [Lasiosphaeria miniovina]